MIAAGAMGFLAMVMMKMQDNQIKTQNTVMVRTEMMSFMSKLNGYLSRSDYCEKTFADFHVTPDTTIELESIVNPLGREIFKVGEKYGNNAFTLESIKQHDFMYDHEEKRTAILTLRVAMIKKKKTLGARRIVKDLEVNLLFDEEFNVIGCGSNIGNINAQLNMNDPAMNVEGLVKAMKNADNLDDPQLQEKMQEAMKKNPTLKMLKQSLDSIKQANESYEVKEGGLKKASQDSQ